MYCQDGYLQKDLPRLHFWEICGQYLKTVWVIKTFEVFVLVFTLLHPSGCLQRRILNLVEHLPSWHSDVVTTLWQRRCWRCHNVVTRSQIRVAPTSVSDVVTTSLSDVIKTLPQRCCNVATTFSIGFLGHFTTDYSDFFPFIETWES